MSTADSSDTKIASPQENKQKVDEAFRELAKLKGSQPATPEEEDAVQSKVHELKNMLQSQGHNADTDSLQRGGWTKPRPTRYS